MQHVWICITQRISILRQNLFDIRIQSTLGLTEDDVDALTEVDGVLEAEGACAKSIRKLMMQASAELTV